MGNRGFEARMERGRFIPSFREAVRAEWMVRRGRGPGVAKKRR